MRHIVAAMPVQHQSDVIHMCGFAVTRAVYLIFDFRPDVGPDITNGLANRRRMTPGKNWHVGIIVEHDLFCAP